MHRKSGPAGRPRTASCSGDAAHGRSPQLGHIPGVANPPTGVKELRSTNACDGLGALKPPAMWSCSWTASGTTAASSALN